MAYGRNKAMTVLVVIVVVTLAVVVGFIAMNFSFLIMALHGD
jgi:hypothetical protein